MIRSLTTHPACVALVFALAAAGMLRAGEGAVGLKLGRVAGKVTVLGIVPGSSAEQSRVPLRSVVLKVDGNAVPPPYTGAHVARMIAAAAESVMLDILVPGDKNPKQITLKKSPVPLVTASRFARQKNHRAAVEALNATRDLWPRDYQLVRMYVMQQKALGNLLDAGVELRALSEKHPDVATYAFGLGACYLDSDKIRATQYLQRAHKLDSDAWEPVMVLAVACSATPNGFAKAIRILEEYAEGHPAEAEAHRYLGWCYSKTGRKGKAMECRKRALELGAEDLAPRLGMQLARANQWREAAAYYELAADILPHHGGVQTTFRWLQSKSGAKRGPWFDATIRTPELIFEESFARPDTPPEKTIEVLGQVRWQLERAGRFEIKDGRLVSPSHAECRLALKHPNWLAMNTLECEVTRLGGGNDLMILFPGSYVQLLNNRVFIYNQNKRSRSADLAPDHRPEIGRPLRLRYVQRGRRLEIFINGKSCATFSSMPPYHLGDINLRTRATSYAFRNLRVYRGVKTEDTAPEGAGAPQPQKAEIKCPKCGKTPPEAAKFCPHCGAKLPDPKTPKPG